MKQLAYNLILTVVTISIVSAQSIDQTETTLKGSNYLSYRMSGSVNKYQGIHTNQELRFGRLICDQVLIGFSTNLELNNRIIEARSGIFSRYYLGNGRISPFLEGSYSFGVSTFDLTSGTEEISTSKVGVGFFGGGISVLNQKRFGVELFGGFEHRHANRWNSRFGQSYYSQGELKGGLRFVFRFN